MDIVHTEEVKAKRIEDRLLSWLIAGEGAELAAGATRSECCASCLVKFEPGASAKPPHSHADCEEIIYILEGQGEMRLAGGEARPIKQGDLLVMRRGEIHLLANTGTTALKALCFYSSVTDNTKYDYYEMDAIAAP
jgi:quercetin dioxygenase-like cupin family protein